MHVQLVQFNGQKQPRSQAPYSLVSQQAQQKCSVDYAYRVTHKKLDKAEETRLIFTVKVTVLEYFDRFPAAKNPFWPLTALWPWSKLWLQGIKELPPHKRVTPLQLASHASHSLHRERKGLVTLQLPSWR